VSDYWTQKVVSWFPKHEIQQMAMMFGSQETIHAVAYSYLNETLKLEDYEAFLHEPATADRIAAVCHQVIKSICRSRLM
jgi:ribonucleoside-diphosphate reductase beta chain